MRRFVLLLSAVACAGAPSHRAVSPTALRGVVLGLPPVEDARPSDNAGCGQSAPDLPQRTEKALYTALADAGAQVAHRGPWMLTVRVLYGGAGEEYVGSGRTPPSPDRAAREDVGVFAEPRGGINAGWTQTSVSLDAELSREARVVWHGTASGHARSAPCVQPREMLSQALTSAVDDLRDRVIGEIARSP